MLINGSAINATAINAAAAGGGEGYDWEALAPEGRQTIYQAQVGSIILPISSFQSSMRLTGQSFLQMVVPGGDEYVDALAAEAGSLMVISKGYRYDDGSLSPLEPIAQAPFDDLRDDEGQRGLTLTLSGYGLFEPTDLRVRILQGITYRSNNQGRRRVRCEIDTFMRPGDTAVDEDELQFTVGVIQHFVGARSEFMEIVQDG